MHACIFDSIQMKWVRNIYIHKFMCKVVSGWNEKTMHCGCLCQTLAHLDYAGSVDLSSVKLFITSPVLNS